MKRYIINFLLLFCCNESMLSQSFSAYTTYAWDEWRRFGYFDYTGRFCPLYWKFYYSGEWVYAYSDQPRDFHFRFNYNDLGLKELSRQEWKKVKNNQKWYETSCRFEYYITDDYPTIKKQLSKASWPCARYYYNESEGRPIVSKSEYVTVKVQFTDDDEVRALNFFFADDCAFAITVNWDYSGNNMTYKY
ncbi:MAG: hypothetical protein K6A78_09450 [Prevotella sp.]|nr:hypothetical protein [Prevotella sp.]